MRSSDSLSPAFAREPLKRLPRLRGKRLIADQIRRLRCRLCHQLRVGADDLLADEMNVAAAVFTGLGVLPLALPDAEERSGDIARVAHRGDADCVREDRSGFDVELHEVRILQHCNWSAAGGRGEVGDMAIGASTVEGEKIPLARVEEPRLVGRLPRAPIRSEEIAQIYAPREGSGRSARSPSASAIGSCRNAARRRSEPI